MTEIVDFLSNLGSKIMEYIAIAFFWSADALADLLMKTGLVENETTAIVVGIFIMFIIFLIIVGTTIGTKNPNRSPFDGGGDD